MTFHDLYLLSPELSVALLAAIVITTDLLFKNKRILPFVTVVGLIVPLFFSVHLSGTTVQDGFFGVLRVDSFSLFFKYLVLAATAIVVISSNEYAKRFGNHQGEYYSLILFSSVGMMLLASTTELITMYIALELAALPTAALAAFIRESRSAESGMKFLILSAISSAILLYGMVLVYGFTGSSQLDQIAANITELGVNSSPALILGLVLITAGFGFKISAVPFQMWAPDVYEGTPTPITGFLSVASKAAGFAVILRVFYTAFGVDSFNMDWANLIAILSALSMSVGNLIAIRQENIKRMLAYSTIAQAGYLMVGGASVTALQGSAGFGADKAGPSGVLFYLAGYAMTNLTAFSVIIAISNKTNSDMIDSFAGLVKKSPLMAAAMTLSMISLIGIPPTVGFMAKIYIFGAAMDTGLWWLATIGVINSVISAYYYLRVVKVMFISEATESLPLRPDVGAASAAMVAMIATLVFGLYPAPIINFAYRAVNTIIS